MAAQRGDSAKRRALVVYSRVGGGHRSAAEALSAALQAESSGEVVPRLFDVYVEGGRFPVTRFPEAYAWLARSGPAPWAALFRATNRPSGGRTDPMRALRLLLQGGVRRVLAADQPSVVLSTLPVVNGVLAELAQELRRPAPLEVVATDWADLHGMWVAPGVDRYTVATEPARDGLVTHGVAEERVDVVGIPVRKPFAGSPLSAEEQAEVRTSVGLEARRFTILVMVGAEGSPRALDNLRALLGQPLTDTQVVVVCGRGTTLRHAVEALPASMPTVALGFVDNVADLMRSADLLVTKAGGVTLAEAFCAGPPVLVHDVLPGQEEGNLRYVLSRQAVGYAATPASLAEQVARLRSDASERQSLAARGQALGRPNAAVEIARSVLSRVA